MKIDHTITITNPNVKNIQNSSQEIRKSAAKQKNSEKYAQSVYAGDFHGGFSLQDRITQRREQAQRQALKIVGDAWDGDRKIEEQLNKSRERIRELQQSNKEAQDNLRDIEAQSADLMKTYGITEDDEEWQELELLRRRRAAMRGEGSLTEEEWKRSFEIEAKGLTEYQQRQMELDEWAENNQRIIEENTREIVIENAVIRGIKEERRKVHPMSDATKQAEAVMDAVGQEIIGMVAEDAKEKIDEEKEQREETAEIVEEKREAQEELIEERREKDSKMEELIEEFSVDETLQMDGLQEQLQSEVQNIVNRMKLVAEDIKGAAVDTNI